MDWPLDLPAREVLKPAGQETIPWAAFDAAWYAKAHPEIGARDPDALLRYYLETGQRVGHAPNLLFDEAWHRTRYPMIAAAIEAGQYASAFDAYCRRGCLDRSPHWLFDELGYRYRYPLLTPEVMEESRLANRYHHYLRHGCQEGRIGHPLFVPDDYLANLEAGDADAAREAGAFLHYLRRIDAGEPEVATSPYFDPVWYLRRYPQVAAGIAAGTWNCALHHYLCNDMPTDFDPLPDFSEAHYLARDPGLRGAIESGQFRNGYAHFLRFGATELRSPSAAIDLRAYAAQARVRSDLQHRLAADAFTHWLCIGKRLGLMPGDPLMRQALDPLPRTLFERAAQAMLPGSGRHGYDFTCAGDPPVSVVMIVRDGFATTMATIGSLRDNMSGDVELVAVDCGSTDETQALADYVAGLRWMRFDAPLDWAQAANAGIAFATAPVVLFLDATAQLAPGAVQLGLDRLARDAGAAAVCGMIVQPQGVIGQAGGIVWQDGAAEDYLRGQSPLMPEANFARPVDYGSAAFLMVRSTLLAELSGFDVACGQTGHAAVDLCLRIAGAGHRVMFDPSIVVFCDVRVHRPGEPSETFLVRHAAELARRTRRSGAAMAAAREAGPRPPRVLFIEDTVPLRRIGSGFVRANDLVRVLASLGFSVTVFPVLGSTFEIPRIYRDVPDSVEVLHDRAADRFKELLASRQEHYDVVWICRTHNLDAVHADLDRWLAQQTHRPLVVLDTEAVAPLRDAQQASLKGEGFDLDAAVAAAFRNASAADVIATVHAEEAAFLQERGIGPVRVVGHMVEPRPTPRPFAPRGGMLFVGAIHSEDSPNYDSLLWFAGEVLPLIEAALGWETRLNVAGYVAPGVSLAPFERHPRITLHGAVGNLEPLYNSARVFVAPTRFAAGAPYKVFEAASHGVPVVATGTLCEALGWTPEEEIMAMPADPQSFADAVIAVHQQEDLWRRLRSGALRRLRRENARQGFVDAVSRVLATVPRSGPDKGMLKP